MVAAALRIAGELSLKAQDYVLALERFQKAVKILCDPTIVPISTNDIGGIACEFYQNMNEWERVELQGCCRGMGAALAKLGREEEVGRPSGRYPPILMS